MKSFLLLLAALVLHTPASFAYFIAVPGTQADIDYASPARILVSGRGTDLGIQPQQSALGVALLYGINFPMDQVVLISVFENESNESALIAAGWKILVKNDIKLETQSATAELIKFNKIRSLEFFGHNSPSLGTQADGLGYRFDFREPVVRQLTPLFTEGAFAFIHGCNSGWIIAQDLSYVWNIPVGSSFTETRFERLHSDGHFYVYTDAKAPNANWATSNPDLGVTDCRNGGCIRMRPAYSAYRGKWGDFSGPLLSHYKFFCQLETKECEKRMASAMYGFLVERSLKPGSTFEDFREAAKQYLCPLYKDRKITEDCLRKLDTSEANPRVSYVVGNDQLVCTLKSCKAKMTCTDHGCTIKDRVSKGSTTLTDEFHHLLNGFRYLQAEGL